MNKSTTFTLICLVLTFTITTSLFSAAQLPQIPTDSKKLQPRLEIGTGVRVGQNSNEAEGTLISLILDFSKKISKHSEISIRTLPIFTYFQNKGEEDLFGFGVGIAYRIYFKECFVKSPYIELHEIAALHQNKFEDNDSNINFNSAIAIGYQINDNWDLTLRFSHFSNAKLKENNDSTNLISIHTGYKF